MNLSNVDTSLIKALLSSPKGDLISRVLLYIYHYLMEVQLTDKECLLLCRGKNIIARFYKCEQRTHVGSAVIYFIALIPVMSRKVISFLWLHHEIPWFMRFMS